MMNYPTSAQNWIFRLFFQSAPIPAFQAVCGNTGFSDRADYVHKISTDGKFCAHGGSLYTFIWRRIQSFVKKLNFVGYSRSFVNFLIFVDYVLQVMA